MQFAKFIFLDGEQRNVAELGTLMNEHLSL